jgi:hypothetical protein
MEAQVSAAHDKAAQKSPAYDKAAQWLADLHEDLDLVRYPTRVEMLRAVNEAARRADCLIRLEHAVANLR